LNDLVPRFQGKQKTRYDPWEVARKKLILVANSKMSLVGKVRVILGRNPGWLSTGAIILGEIEKASKND
jgi:hypothetical protein